jgi:hypothetical protein
MTVAAMFCLGMAIGLGLGCQRGQTSAPSPVVNTASAATPATPPTSATPATEAAVVPPAPTHERAHITLPKSSTSPLRRTRRPFTSKQLAWLSSFEFKDFVREDGGTTDEAVEIRHTTTTRPRFGVSVRIDRCPPAAPAASRRGRARHVEREKPVTTDARPCLPMQLPPWQDRRDELKQFMSRDLAMRSDTRFDIGARRVDGATAISTYQLGHLFALDDRNQTVALSSTAYALYYNDGINRIRVMANYLDDAVPTRGQLVDLAPPRELERMAVAFTRFYLHHWQ